MSNEIFLIIPAWSIITRTEQTTICSRQRQRKNSFPHSPDGYLELDCGEAAQPQLASPLVELDGELDAGQADDGHDEAGRLVDVDVRLVENHPECRHRWPAEPEGLQVDRTQFDPEIQEDANRVGKCGQPQPSRCTEEIKENYLCIQISLLREVLNLWCLYQ